MDDDHASWRRRRITLDHDKLSWRWRRLFDDDDLSLSGLFNHHHTFWRRRRRSGAFDNGYTGFATAWAFDDAA
jgi:hypothetical protein